MCPPQNKGLRQEGTVCSYVKLEKTLLLFLSRKHSYGFLCLYVCFYVKLRHTSDKNWNILIKI